MTSLYAVVSVSLGDHVFLAHHSRSANPMKPIFIPFEDVSVVVFWQFAIGIPFPRAGSSTFAISHGK